ncbi:MAG: hypothetical protein U5L11_06420 [Arhodomonas sp.]|nr:hypothetical protein [Arhodomonas sp.]
MSADYPIVREPSDYELNRSNMANYIRWLEGKGHGPFPDYHALHRWSVDDIERFWESIWIYRRAGHAGL